MEGQSLEVREKQRRWGAQYMTDAIMIFSSVSVSHISHQDTLIWL